MKKIKLFYDLDNTGFLFATKQTEKEIIEKGLHLQKGYFRNLKPLDGFCETVEKLVSEGYDVCFLTHYDAKHPHIIQEKRDCCAEHVPCIGNDKIIVVPTGQSKADFIEEDKICILIDDYGVNLRDWQEKGGIPVKKRSSFKRGDWRFIVRHHSDIFKILAQLEF